MLGPYRTPEAPPAAPARGTLGQSMICAYCSCRCIWPVDFPASHYAQCADCTEIELLIRGWSWWAAIVEFLKGAV